MNSAASSNHAVNFAWFKSSYSSDQGGNCVEVAIVSGAVHVRDSKTPSAPMLTVATDAWAALVRFAGEVT